MKYRKCVGHMLVLLTSSLLLLLSLPLSVSSPDPPLEASEYGRPGSDSLGGLLVQGNFPLSIWPGAGRTNKMNSSQTTLTPNPEKLCICLPCNKTAQHRRLKVLFNCVQVPAPVIW